MLHVVASNLITNKPELTAKFLQDTLNFSIELKGNHWWADNGSVCFYLLEENGEETGTLRLQSSNFDTDSFVLIERDDVHPVSDKKNINNTLTQTFLCDCGLKLLLFHELDEDERDELMPLPITLEWDDSVILSTQRILKVTPIPFRDKARIETTQKAEYKAVAEGKLAVNISNAMQALSEITPSFQHQSLFEAMLKEGVDAGLYLDSSTWENAEDQDV